MVREGAGGVRLGFADGASARLRRHRSREEKGGKLIKDPACAAFLVFLGVHCPPG